VPTFVPPAPQTIPVVAPVPPKGDLEEKIAALAHS
jgi:hypothetical protein